MPLSKLDDSYGVVYGHGYEEDVKNGRLSLLKGLSTSGKCLESFLSG